MDRLSTVVSGDASDLPLLARLLVLANPALVRLGLARPPAALVAIRSDQRHRTVLERVEVSKPGVLF